MRTITNVKVVNLAATLSPIISPNYIVDIAIANLYTYDDYSMLCTCMGRAPQTEKTYISAVVDDVQLSLAGIC